MGFINFPAVSKSSCKKFLPLTSIIIMLIICFTLDGNLTTFAVCVVDYVRAEK